MKPKSLFAALFASLCAFAPRHPEKCEFVNLMDFGDEALSAEFVIM